MDFNPRSHERSDERAKSVVPCYMDFNPRSHERSDRLWDLHLTRILRISIHAPTRGATVSFYRNFYPHKNFNPRSHERSDISRKIYLQILHNFNPRSHERSDREVITRAQELRQISIHAPTRGATALRSGSLHVLSDFNPRSHERSDSNIAQKICLFLYNTDNKYIIR